MDTWRLNNMPLMNDWVKEEVKREIKRCIGTNDNDSTTYQKCWNTTKAAIRRKFIPLHVYLKKHNEPK